MKLHVFGRPKPELSALDMPVEDYDPVTHLPERIQIGGFTVKPFVQVKDLQDHLTILATFAQVASHQQNFARYATKAAEEYEYWALSVMPVRARRRNATSHSPSGSGSTNTSPAVSRRSSQRPQVVPTPAAVALAMGVARSDSDPTPSSASWDYTSLAGQSATHASQPHPKSLLGTHPPSQTHPHATHTAHHHHSHSYTSHSHSHSARPLGAPLKLTLPHSHTPTEQVQSPTAMSPFSSVSSLPSSPASHTPRRDRHTLPASELPPLPVLMAWHAHLVNPRQYALDTAPKETYSSLVEYTFPLEAVAAAIRSNSLPTELEHVPQAHFSSLEGWRVPDISAAIQRQARLISVIRNVGWLEPEFINGPIDAMQRAIIRYHCWLDLFTATGSPKLGATMDIEMVWRTHQLAGARYRSNMETVLGRPLEQMDRGDDSLVKRTAGYWVRRFGHPYEEGNGKKGIKLPHGFRHPTRRSTAPV